MLQFSAFEPKVFNIPLMTVVYHMSLTALGLIVICFSYLINQRQIVDIIYFLRQTLELDAYVQSASATVMLKYITGANQLVLSSCPAAEIKWRKTRHQKQSPDRVLPSKLSDFTSS